MKILIPKEVGTTKSITTNGMEQSLKNFKSHLELIEQNATRKNRALVSVTNEKNNAREIVRNLLRFIMPASTKIEQPVLADDLHNLRDLIGAISKAQKSSVLSENEAESIIALIINKFVERRFDSFLSSTLAPSSSKWFMVASGKTYGREQQQRRTGELSGH